MNMWLAGFFGFAIGTSFACAFVTFFASKAKAEYENEKMTCDVVGHDFEVVYDHTWEHRADFDKPLECSTYVHHVCTECGKVVDRSASQGITISNGGLGYMYVAEGLKANGSVSTGAPDVQNVAPNNGKKRTPKKRNAHRQAR